MELRENLPRRNEIKAGYKQTDVGIIPEDWNIERIRTICSISTGSRNTQDKIEDGSYPFFVRSQTVERINSYSFNGEAILTAGDGVGTGKIFHYINGKFDFHQRVYKLSDFAKNINGYFFFLYFSNNFYNRIVSMTAKSSVDSVRLEMIADMPIPIPSIEEQTAIAQALSDTDELISSLEKLIEKKKLIKQGTMQQLLTGKKRLPGFSGEWEIKKLVEIFQINAGGDLNKNDFSLIKDEKYSYPIYSNSLTENGLYGYSSTYTEYENTITVTARGTIGKANCRDHKYSAIGRVLILTPLMKLDCLFISECINSLIDFAYESTGVPQLTAPQIGKYELTIPSFEEQSSIACILRDIDSEIEVLEQKLNKYKAIKQGMMQELLTGRIRLI